AGGVEEGGEVAVALEHRQAHQGLRAGHEGASARERVLVVERDLGETRRGVKRGVHRSSLRARCICSRPGCGASIGALLQGLCPGFGRTACPSLYPRALDRKRNRVVLWNYVASQRPSAALTSSGRSRVLR